MEKGTVDGHLTNSRKNVSIHRGPMNCSGTSVTTHLQQDLHSEDGGESIVCITKDLHIQHMPTETHEIWSNPRKCYAKKKSCISTTGKNWTKLELKKLHFTTIQKSWALTVCSIMWL